ncbi:MAG: 50S ribosomal protein L25 [Woronichinia naegeliana WA131]|jgi:large subunit ribosomal protein L25|uniref:50S ribosomal protein L25 n=1 Tax=Woronichinia naegeliana WA131 TaxID=2824559 RepID=A0A977KV20_9CYAN|nr:MAG: 50S ribosomal protein L25 [Woronichinia naegeliana WA131]
MSVTTIECQKRPENSNPKALRREGLIPATLYGHNGTESISLTVGSKEAVTLLRYAKANETLVDVKIPDLSWEGKALIREIQSHPWKRTLYHLSFFYVANANSAAAAEA